MRGELADRLLVGHRLLVLGWGGCPFQEEKLGAEQADASRAEGKGGLSLLRGADIGEERDLGAVDGAGRKRGLVHVALVALSLRERTGLEARERRRIGVEHHVTSAAIDGKRLPPAVAVELREEPVDSDHGRNAIGARQDRSVGGGRRALQGDAQQEVARQGRGDRRRQILRHHDRGSFERCRRRAATTGEMRCDPACDIHDILGAGREQLVVQRAQLLGEGASRGHDGGDRVVWPRFDARLRQRQQRRIARDAGLGLEDLALVGVPVGGDAFRQCVKSCGGRVTGKDEALKLGRPDIGSDLSPTRLLRRRKDDVRSVHDARSRSHAVHALHRPTMG